MQGLFFLFFYIILTGELSSIILGFEWVQADAENLPFEDDSLDLYTIAFGIRNTTHIDKVCCVMFGISKYNEIVLYFILYFCTFDLCEMRYSFSKISLLCLNL